ncbi:MAG: polysaccharide biosynthesis protein [Gammaproteobacteria bacterium]|nr:polysaccharide biosynthesis protein [Gammaproteobacteria bacterium]
MPSSSQLSDLRSGVQNSVQFLRFRILGLSRATKQFAMITADTVVYIACVYLSAWLIFGIAAMPTDLTSLSVIAVLIAIPITWLMGLYRSIVRYMGIDLFIAGTKSTLIAAALIGTVAWITNVIADPARWAIVFWALSLIFIVGCRFLARLFLNQRNTQRERVIVYGAGDGGARLTAALFAGHDYLPVALVDDDVNVQGKRVCGIEVYSPSEIDSLIRVTDSSGVLLAIPSASRRRRRAVLERLSELPVRVQTIPEVSDLVAGHARVDDIRDVDVEDLLGRDAVPPDAELLGASIAGKRVMVTGAGGSIGSELCRQIIQLRPRTLVLFEISEYALYNINMELSQQIESQGLDCELVALLGSVNNQDRVQEVLETFRVNTVYHAAAYKHVPVVEHNLLEGLQNNIIGTLSAAKAAVEANVDTFVLVSTDKAVSPTSVMGATKRFAEMVLQALQDKYGSTRFCMVRFGNVLASSGSVVPLFREQIRQGGPVTVTHREIIRYFMTIPEAAQLVIQAGGMAEGGDVFVLDMGKPVKIQNLARSMISLMGLTVRDEDNPDGDIEIQYTGLRPAEKLYEELLIGNNVSGTRHPRIMRAREDYLDIESLNVLVGELKMAAQQRDRNRAREILLDSVSGYEPSNAIEDLVWVRQNARATAESSENVIDITTRRA